MTTIKYGFATRKEVMNAVSMAYNETTGSVDIEKLINILYGGYFVKQK